MISIIVPVFNEGANISVFIHTLEQAVKINHEVLVIFDFDKDNTIPIAKNLKRKYSNILLVKNNLGTGVINAFKTGFIKSSGDFIVVMPADLADDPNTINKMYELAIKGYDIICATRYSKGGKQLRANLVKSLFSRLAGIATPILLNIPTTDITNGYKMYRRKVLKRIEIQSKAGWEFSMEIVIKANSLGFKITEVPSIWRERSHGKSKFKFFKWLPNYIYWYIWGIILRLKQPFGYLR